MSTDLERRIAQLKHGDHICPIHEGNYDPLNLVLPFISKGFERNEQVLLVVDDTGSDAVLERLAEKEIDAESAVKRGALRLLAVHDCYLRDGAFSPQAMIAWLAEAEAGALAAGYAGMRFLGQMTWMLTAQVAADKLIEYEARLNCHLAKSRTVVLCQYHRQRFDPAVIHDVLRTHPLVILNDMAVPNPYYEPPELLLQPGGISSAEFKKNRVDWWLERLRSVLASEKERAELVEQLGQAQKFEAIGRLAGGIAHDFNNLLTVIIGHSKLILKDMSPVHPLYKQIELFQRTGLRAAGLTKQLLQYSRQEIQQLRTLNVNRIVTDLEAMLRPLLGEDIELRLKLESSPCLVRGDSTQLGQIVMNLAANARDAMPDGGQLVIETRNVDLDASYASARHEVKPGPYVMIAVSDSGGGMSQEVQRRIFEPFFTTKEFGKGTGLGLSIVYGIVKQSGGHVFVYSEPGRGTTFKIYLPACHESAESQVAPQAQTGDITGTETVLIVEDEAHVLGLMRDILEELGYQVLATENGPAAIQLAENFHGPIKLLISDVVMPSMSGKALSETLLKLRPDLKVLFTSGYTYNVIVNRGVLDEGIHFIEKPFQPEAFGRKVRTVLDG